MNNITIIKSTILKRIMPMLLAIALVLGLMPPAIPWVSKVQAAQAPEITSASSDVSNVEVKNPVTVSATINHSDIASVTASVFYEYSATPITVTSQIDQYKADMTRSGNNFSVQFTPSSAGSLYWYVNATDGINSTASAINCITVTRTETEVLKLIGRYSASGTNPVAEIVKYDPVSQNAFVVNGQTSNEAIDIIDLSVLEKDRTTAAALNLSKKIKISDLTDFAGFSTGDITCIDIHPSSTYFAVSIPASSKNVKGRVAFFTIAGDYLGYVTVGYLPDNLAFTPDGNTLLVANEGEPLDSYTEDPVGSVSYIDVSKGGDNIKQADVTDIGFTGVPCDTNVIIKQGSTPEQDFEPEYIAVDSASKYAYVTLQENNAIAKLDIPNKTFVRVFGLGFVDHSLVPLDASDKDNSINIRKWPVLGMRMPDGIEIATIGPKTYIVTANEGDGREYGIYKNELRVKDIKTPQSISLKATNYQGYTQSELDQMASTVKNDSNLGRLTIHSEMGKNGSVFESLYSFGSRSFSIFDASDMSLVYDSGSEFEEITAEKIPQYFNCSNSNTTRDDRSDNKGPEPEDVKVGKVGNKYYAFVGLERIGGVMVYDITNPANPKFLEYKNTRDFSQAVAGDAGPEGIKFISRKDSPIDAPVLLVANEVSGTLSVFQVKDDSSGPEKNITIVHTNDTHGRLEASSTSISMSAISAKIKQLKQQNPGNVIVLDAGDTFHGQSIINLSQGAAMVDIMNTIGYDAMVPGNHDFNFGQARLVELSGMAKFPLLAANVVKQDSSLLLDDYIVKTIDGVKVGIFGLTTPETTYKTHPKNVEGLTFQDPVTVARQMVNKLRNQENVDIVVAIAHLGVDASSIDTSTKLANEVTGINMIIDGHSHTEMPTGRTVNGTLIVQTGEYSKNLGIVDITYNQNTKAISLSPSLMTKAQSASIKEDVSVKVKVNKAKAENESVLSQVIGSSDVVLNGTRADVRTKETNLGNLITDAMLDITGADVAFTNGGGIRASIDIGDITKGEVLAVLPFGNIVVVKDVTGQDIINALELGISSYPAEKGAFPHVAGMKVKYAVASPKNKVAEITINGNAINPSKRYKLATNDFIAAGGDGYTMFTDDKTVGEYPGLDEVLTAYIKKQPNSKITNNIAKLDGRMKVVENIQNNTQNNTQTGSSSDETKQLVQNTDGSVKLEAKPEINTLTGEAKTEIKQEMLSKALEIAKAASDGVKSVLLEIPKAQGASAYQPQLPVSALTSVSANVKLVIVTEIAKIAVPSNMFANNKDVSGAKNIGISVCNVKKDTLSSEVKTKVAERPVVELSVNADGKKISQDSQVAPVTVEIPYKPSVSELANTEHIVVLSIDASGKAKPVTSGRYNAAKGAVEFTTTQLNKFAVAYVQKTFSDLESHSWAKKQIEVMASKGIIEGRSEASFDPTSDITRGDFMKLMMQTFGLTEKADQAFDDVKPTDYYYQAIATARMLGITTGTGSNRFNPEQKITRQEMMVMVARAMKHVNKLKAQVSPSELSKFEDISEVDSYAFNDLAAMVKEGIIQGYGSSIKAKANTTRAEAAVILYRVYNK
ncbi:MAG: choice-of-anchor I family protein [Clostridia bacterium]|nr:choice-of-anchor I family protein [Clostridia bacterium]